MEFIEHSTEKGLVVEVRSREVVIQTEQDALDIMESNKGRQVNFVPHISDAL